MSPYSSSSSAAFSSSPAPSEHQSAVARESAGKDWLFSGQREGGSLTGSGEPDFQARSCPLDQSSSSREESLHPLHQPSLPHYGAMSRQGWDGQEQLLCWASPGAEGQLHGLVPTHGHRASALPQQSPRSSTAALPVSSWKDL